MLAAFAFPLFIPVLLLFFLYSSSTGSFDSWFVLYVCDIAPSVLLQIEVRHVPFSDISVWAFFLLHNVFLVVLRLEYLHLKQCVQSDLLYAIFTLHIIRIWNCFRNICLAQIFSKLQDNKRMISLDAKHFCTATDLSIVFATDYYMMSSVCRCFLFRNSRYVSLLFFFLLFFFVFFCCFIRRARCVDAYICSFRQAQQIANALWDLPTKSKLDIHGCAWATQVLDSSIHTLTSFSTPHPLLLIPLLRQWKAFISVWIKYGHLIFFQLQICGDGIYIGKSAHPNTRFA